MKDLNEKQFAIIPVKRLFFYLILPSVTSRIFSTLYIMVDGIVVGRWIGEEALAAVNLIMPVLSILFALSDMIAVGSSVKVSKTLGEGDEDASRKLFSAVVLIILGMGVVFTLFGLFLFKPMIFAMVDDPSLAQMVYDYGMVYVYTFPIIMPLFAMDNFLRGCGKTKYCMWINVGVSVGNIFFDWLFVVHLHMGVASTAVATVASMAIGSLFQFAPFFTKKLSLYYVRPHITWKEIGRILYNGSAEFFGTTAWSLMMILINALLLSLGGSLSVAAYSAVMYIDSLLIGALYGMSDATQPAISYNLGARKIHRTFSFFHVSCVSMTVMSLAFLAAIVLFPEKISLIFTQGDNADMLKMTVKALVLYAPTYLFKGFNVTASTFLTAVDKPREAVVIMVFSAVLNPAISLLLLTPAFGLDGVLASNGLSAGLTCLVAFIIWRRTAKKLRQLPEA